MLGDRLLVDELVKDAVLEHSIRVTRKSSEPEPYTTAERLRAFFDQPDDTLAKLAAMLGAS